MALVELPIEDLPDETYIVRHVEVVLDRGQAETLRRVHEGLHRSGGKLKNGKFVKSPPDTIKYILDSIVL